MMKLHVPLLVLVFLLPLLPKVTDSVQRRKAGKETPVLYFSFVILLHHVVKTVLQFSVAPH